MTEASKVAQHHVHHSYIWLGSIQIVFTLLFLMLVTSFSAVMGIVSEGASLLEAGLWPALLIIVGVLVGGFFLIVGLIVLAQWWSYKHLYYEIGVTEFSLYSGIFNKKRVHIPYHRIQSVDQHATLLQRIFGVCEVRIDTAGGSANKAVKVPYLQKATAEQLRRELFARKNFAIAQQSGVVPQDAVGLAYGEASSASLGHQGQNTSAITWSQTAAQGENVLDAPVGLWDDARGIFAGDNVDLGKVSYEHGLTNRELIFTGLSNGTAFGLIVVGILVAVIELGDFLLPTLQVSGNLASSALQGGAVALGAATFVAFTLFLWGLSAVKTCISFGGFKARRRGSRIEVEHGLLQHQVQGVEVERVQSVIVKQSFIRRLLGYCELSLGKIDAPSESEQQSQPTGIIIHPFVKLNKVPNILAGLVPEFADVPIDNIAPAPVALRRALIRRGIWQNAGVWLAVFVGAIHAALNAFANPGDPADALIVLYANRAAFAGYALSVILIAVNITGAVLWFRGSGFAYNNRFMQISNAGLARETVSFPRKKIQFGYTKSNPLQRRADTVTIHARTAAGVGGTTLRLIDVRVEDAQEWMEWLQPRKSVVKYVDGK